MRSEIRAAATNATTRSGSTSPNDAIRRIGWSGGGPRQARDGEAGDEVAHLAPDPLADRGVVAALDGLDDPAADPAHLGRTHAAGRRGRGPDADPGRDGGRVGVERDGVLVDGDADVVEERLGLAA